MSHIKLVYGATPSGEIDYCEAFEQLDSGLCVIGADGSVAANNQAFRDFLGLPADWVSPVELAGKTVSASEELVAGWRARVKTLGDFAETIALTEELNLRVKGKTLASGGVSLSVARAADNRAPVAGVTTQAAAQRALRESEAKFQALFEGAGVGISLIDADGTILDTNPALTQMFDMNRDQIVGKSFRDLTMPQDLARSTEIYGGLIAGNLSVIRQEKQYLRGNGEKFTASLNISVIRDEDENFMFSVAVIEDCLTSAPLGQIEVIA